MGFPLALHHFEPYPQVHLHCLAVKIEGFLGDYRGPVSKVLLGDLDSQVAEIAQPVLLLVYGNPLRDSPYPRAVPTLWILPSFR